MLFFCLLDQRPQASADSGPSSSVADEQSMSAKSATSASSSAATAAAAESGKLKAFSHRLNKM